METIETIINGYRARMQQADRALDSLQRRILPHQYAAPAALCRGRSGTHRAALRKLDGTGGHRPRHVRAVRRANPIPQPAFCPERLPGKRKGSEQAGGLPPWQTMTPPPSTTDRTLPTRRTCTPSTSTCSAPARLFQYLNRTCTQPGKTAWPPGWASTWRIRPPSRPGRRPCANWQRPPASANASAYWDCYTRARRPTKANCAPGQPRLPPSATTRC